MNYWNIVAIYLAYKSFTQQDHLKWAHGSLKKVPQLLKQLAKFTVTLKLNIFVRRFAKSTTGQSTEAKNR